MNKHSARVVALTALILTIPVLVYANPIHGDMASQNIAARARSAADQPLGRRVQRALPSSVTFAEYAAEVSVYPGGDPVCGFGTTCYSTITAPEPQSFLLVGGGLLALAGLVRRRLVR